jgi:hypothetical protein
MALAAAQPDALLPSPAQVFNEWAKTRTALTALVGTRISPVLQTLPSIRLAVVSGRDVGRGEVRARLQVECWAADHDTAETIVRTVVAEVPALRGSYAGGWVGAADVATAPYAAPDPVTERPRFIVDLWLWLYPTAPTP